MASKHTSALKEIRNRPELIGEDPRTIRDIILEPTWRKGPDLKTMPDIIIVHKKYTIECEVKASEIHFSKAMSQLEMGKKYIEEFMGLPFGYGKFAKYGDGIIWRIVLYPTRDPQDARRKSYLDEELGMYY